jgi:hypothetical protein
MNGDDGVLAIVLAAKHLLDFAVLHFLIETVERLRELRINRLARLRPLEEHSQVVAAPFQRHHQVAILFEAAAALQRLLRFSLVFPEIGLGCPRFETAQFFVRAGRLKDNSADRQRAC